MTGKNGCCVNNILNRKTLIACVYVNMRKDVVTIFPRDLTKSARSHEK